MYSGPRQDRRRSSSAGWLRLLPVFFSIVTIGLQIAWPLSSGHTRDALTVAAVITFFLAVATHALMVRGWAWALGWLVMSAGMGFTVEVIGVHTGLPFGHYTYADHLGPSVAGVPITIGLAWAMMSYPCALAARLLVQPRILVAFVGAVALAGWDLFLDPQMVAAGQWSWQTTSPQLPGIDGIPVQNFVGWLLVAFVVMLLLTLLPRRKSDGAVPPDGVPLTLLAWTYLSSILLNLSFEHRPAVAAWGAIVMGLVVVPYLVRAWTDRP